MGKLINFFVGVGLCVSSSIGKKHAVYSHLGPLIWIPQGLVLFGVS